MSAHEDEMVLDKDTLYFEGFPAKPWYLQPPIPLERLEEQLDLLIDGQLGLMFECGLDRIPSDLLLQLTLGNIIGEATEAGEHFGDITKPWKRDLKVDPEHIKKELIDILHFLLQGFIIMGMGGDEIFAAYNQKNRENFRRIMAKRREAENV